MARARWILLVVACGCASTSRDVAPRERVPRTTFRYSDGETFDLEHQNALASVFDPARRRDVADGQMTGHVCGAHVQLDARWFGDTLTLTGYGEIKWPGHAHADSLTTLTLGIHEPAPGRRTIAGQFGGHIFADASSPVVDLDVSADHLEARIGERRFSLAPKGEYLVGRVHEPGAADAPFALYGRSVLSTMAPADEAFALIALLACDGRVEYDNDDIRGFALARLERPKGAIPERDADEPDDDAAAPEPPPDVRRAIDAASAETTVEALSEYHGASAIVYLPRKATDEMRALAASLTDLFERAGLTVEQRPWRTGSCRRPAYDLAVVASEPATPTELAVGVRLTLTKLNAYVCQSANAEPGKLGVLVLPPHR